MNVMRSIELPHGRVKEDTNCSNFSLHGDNSEVTLPRSERVTMVATYAEAEDATQTIPEKLIQLVYSSVEIDE